MSQNVFKTRLCFEHLFWFWTHVIFVRRCQDGTYTVTYSVPDWAQGPLKLEVPSKYQHPYIAVEVSSCCSSGCVLSIQVLLDGHPIRGSPLMPRIIGGGLIQILAGDELIWVSFALWGLIPEKINAEAKVGPCCICNGVLIFFCF